MRRNDEVSMAELFRLADQANLLDDEEVQKLLQAASASSSSQIRRRVKKALEVKAAHHQRYPFADTDTVQPLRLGSTRTGGYVGLTEQDVTKHVLVAGQSGAGKTTLFYNVMQQLAVPWWAFDLKQDYRHLSRNDSNVVVLPWQQLQFNPLEPPPNVRSKRWAQVITEIFGHATALLSGSKNYLLKHLVALYEDSGESWPTLQQLHTAVKEDSLNYARKSANYRDTVSNRLDGVLLSGDSVFSVSSGHVQPELLEKDVVFEFDGLGNDLQNFLMESLFGYVFEYRLANTQRNQGLQHVFFLDEGKRVFSVYKERQDASGIPTIDELTAKMREFGEGLVVADQEPSKLTESIKANTYVKMVLPMGDYNQFREVVDAMDLSQRQRDVAQDLGVGEAVVQVGNAAPAWVDLDYYEVEKSVSDEVLEQLQQQHWDSLDGLLTEPDTGDTPVGEEDDGVSQVDDSDTALDLSETEEMLLNDVVDRPFVSLSDRYEKASSWNKGHQAKQGLVEKGLVRERRIKTSGAKRKLLELTENGREVSSELGIDVGHEGRGGIVHRYWQSKVQEYLSGSGWNCEMEQDDADVVAEKAGVSVAFEIAMGSNEREVEHAEQRIADGFDMIVVICRNKPVVEGLRDRIEDRLSDRDSVAFWTFQELFDGDIDLEERIDSI